MGLLLSFQAKRLRELSSKGYLPWMANKFHMHMLSRWCSVNKLSLNAAKTKLMTFGTRQRVKKCKDVKVSTGGGASLQIVPTYKYLGFTLDSTLSLNSHVNNVTKMVAYKINLLAKIRKYLTDNVALKIYKSMILPYFDI